MNDLVERIDALAVDWSVSELPSFMSSVFACMSIRDDGVIAKISRCSYDGLSAESASTGHWDCTMTRALL